MDKSVERLHRALVQAMRNDPNHDFDRPVTVAEIYQKFLPYRDARAAVGFEMNADYEYALLRLLSGEGDLARLEPVEVREHLRSELESPNPNVSLYRAYANCDVWITPNAADYHFDERTTLEDAFLADNDEVELAFEPDESVVPGVPVTPPTPAGSTAARQQTCVSCGGQLPAGRLLNFCPFCGNDLTRKPCANCGEILDPAWRFCVNCGAPAGGFNKEAN